MIIGLGELCLEVLLGVGYYASLMYNKVEYFVDGGTANSARVNISLAILILILFAHEFYEVHIFSIFRTSRSVYQKIFALIYKIEIFRAIFQRCIVTFIFHV